MAYSVTARSKAPLRRRVWDRWLWATLLVSALLLLLPYQPMAARRVILGEDGAAGVLSGFSFPETAPDGQRFRWSAAEGSVRFTDVANRPLTARMSLHALRPAGSATVTVLVNGQPAGQFTPGDWFTERSFPIARSVLGWSGDVTLAVQVPPFSVPPDSRQLGAAVAWVEIAPAGGPAMPSAPALVHIVVPLLMAVAGAVVFGRFFGLSGPAAAALGVALAVAGALWIYAGPGSAVAWSWAVPVVIWAGGAAIASGPAALRRASAWVRATQRRTVTFWLVAIAVVALAIYLPLARTKGYWGDIEIYMAWTYQITHFGIHTAYSPDVVAPPNTTPGLLFPFRIVGEAFRQFYSPDFPQPWVDRTNQAYLRFMLRLPALIGTAMIAVVVFWLVRRRWGNRMALIAAAAYVFNPAVIFESAYYGQMGAVHSLFILLAVIGLAEGWPARGWAALTVGMLTKPQADLFLPLFGVLTWKRYGWKALLRSILAAAAAGLLILSPFILNGTLGQLWARISHTTDYHPMISATAHNVWWLVSLGNGTMNDLLMPPGLDRIGWPIFTYRAIGLGMVGLAYLLVLVRTWRDEAPETMYLSTAYLFTAFFMLATQIHENHLIPMFSLLLLACPGNRRLWIIYGLFSLTATLNIALHYPDILQVLVPQNPDVWGGPEMAAPRWLSSLLQVSLFVYWTVIFTRETRAALRRPVPAREVDARTSAKPLDSGRHV